VILRLLGDPDLSHGPDAVGQQRHPGARLGAVIGHLHPVPARTDTEEKASGGQPVQARHFLRERDRVALDH